MNIIIAIVIEIHDSLTHEIEEKFKKINARVTLHSMLKNDDRATMKIKLKEAAELIARY